jgi:hypothetical protein
MILAKAKRKKTGIKSFHHTYFSSTSSGNKNKQTHVNHEHIILHKHLKYQNKITFKIV